MSAPRSRALAALAVMFALGVLTGIGGAWFVQSRSIGRLLAAPPDVARRQMMGWMLEKKLDLSAEQRRKIDAIMAQHAPEHAQIAREVEPRFAPLRAKTDGEIRALLSPPQQARFDDLVREREAVRSGAR